MSKLSVEDLLSHSAGFFRSANFEGATTFESRKGLCFRGLCHNFLSKVFLSMCQETSYGIPAVMCVRKFLVAKKFMDKRGGGSIKILRRKFVVSQCRKIS